MTILGFDRSSNFAIGSGGISTVKEEILKQTCKTIAWSGVGHSDVYRHCQKNNLDYYYIDTGYFGNGKHKTYKRITFNALNDCRKLIERPRDRLDRLSLKKQNITRGNQILVVPPDQKVLNCWNPEINLENWISNTVNEIKKFSDRPVVIRERIRSRTDRLQHNTFVDNLTKDINVVVVWSSNCAVEAVLHNIPVVSLGPTATTQVSQYKVEKIDNIPALDNDLVETWMRHLSYSQFTEEEMLSGLAWEYLKP